MPEPEPNPHVDANNARIDGERAAERRAPRFNDLYRFHTSPHEGRLSDELNRISTRMSETVACLRSWHTLNKAGLNVDDEKIPENLKPVVNDLVKSTRRLLVEWKVIPE